jgi:hypothetical protein
MNITTLNQRKVTPRQPEVTFTEDAVVVFGQ